MATRIWSGFCEADEHSIYFSKATSKVQMQLVVRWANIIRTKSSGLGSGAEKTEFEVCALMCWLPSGRALQRHVGLSSPSGLGSVRCGHPLSGKRGTSGATGAHEAPPHCRASDEAAKELADARMLRWKGVRTVQYGVRILEAFCNGGSLPRHPLQLHLGIILAIGGKSVAFPVQVQTCNI